MKSRAVIRILLVILLVGPLLIGPSGEERVSAQTMSRGAEREEPAINWDGVWDSNYGRMELGQHGDVVVGTYGPDKGRMSGSMAGRVLVYHWSTESESGGLNEGWGEFELSDDGENFTGWWSFEGKENRNDWEGYRLEDRVIEGSRANVDFCLWRGAWRMQDGIIAFEQEPGSGDVRGEFLRSGGIGSIEGSADGWSLTFNWTDDSDSGTGEFEMSGDLGSFSGHLGSGTGLESEAWTGNFESGEIRGDFEGEWETNWGALELTLDPDTGSVAGTIENARIGDSEGVCDINGTVIGSFFHFRWVLSGDEGETIGDGVLELGKGGTSILGWWRNENHEEIAGRLVGERT